MGMRKTLQESEMARIDALEIDAEEKDVEPLVSVSRLRELPPGPYRSLGRHLDYSRWADRDRFMELDEAIRFGERNGTELYEQTPEGNDFPTNSSAGQSDLARGPVAEPLRERRGRYSPIPSMVEFVTGFDSLPFRRL